MKHPTGSTFSNLLALLSVLFSAYAASFWARIYLYINSTGFLLFAMVLIAIAAFILLAIACWMINQHHINYSIQVLTAATIGLILYLSIRGEIFSDYKSYIIIPTIISFTIAISYLLKWRWISAWPRIKQFALYGSAIFVISAPLLGEIRHIEAHFFPERDDSTPTIWLLLDESSYGAIDALLEPFGAQGLQIYTSELQASGRNTLDVIPSMILRRQLGNSVAPCGSSLLCFDGGSLDLSRVVVGRDKVDFVVVYHDYCAMLGWRTCVNTTVSDKNWTRQLYEIKCSINNRFGFKGDCSQVGNDLVRGSRRRSLDAIFKAPFWQDGGDLFVHILLPHLPASRENSDDVQISYVNNIKEAQELIGNLLMQLRKKYNDNFRIILFSDHPLRGNPSLKKYSEPFSTPLIVAGPRKFAINHISRNKDILDLHITTINTRN